MHKRKEIVQDVTLHDLDAANARPAGGQDIMRWGLWQVVVTDQGLLSTQVQQRMQVICRAAACDKPTPPTSCQLLSTPSRLTTALCKSNTCATRVMMLIPSTDKVWAG